MRNDQVIIASVEFSDENGNEWVEETTACVECLNKSERAWSIYERNPNGDVWQCACGRTSTRLAPDTTAADQFKNSICNLLKCAAMGDSEAIEDLATLLAYEHLDEAHRPDDELFIEKCETAVEAGYIGADGIVAQFYDIEGVKHVVEINCNDLGSWA